jgi:hypothetical protein
MFGRYNPKNNTVSFFFTIAKDGKRTNGWAINHQDGNLWCKIFLQVEYEKYDEIVYESSFMKPGTRIRNIILERAIRGEHFGLAKQIYFDEYGREKYMEKHLILFSEEE